MCACANVLAQLSISNGLKFIRLSLNSACIECRRSRGSRLVCDKHYSTPMRHRPFLFLL